MAQTAAHLVDRVFPHVPVRQWVLSVPKRLRPRVHPLCRSLGYVLRLAGMEYPEARGSWQQVRGKPLLLSGLKALGAPAPRPSNLQSPVIPKALFLYLLWFHFSPPLLRSGDPGEGPERAWERFAGPDRQELTSPVQVICVSLETFGGGLEPGLRRAVLRWIWRVGATRALGDD